MKKTCENCHLYFENNDTGYECNGQEIICHEYIEEKYKKSNKKENKNEKI